MKRGSEENEREEATSFAHEQVYPLLTDRYSAPIIEERPTLNSAWSFCSALFRTGQSDFLFSHPANERDDHLSVKHFVVPSTPATHCLRDRSYFSIGLRRWFFPLSRISWLTDNGELSSNSSFFKVPFFFLLEIAGILRSIQTNVRRSLLSRFENVGIFRIFTAF